MHALSDCDTVSYPCGKVKESALKVLMNNDVWSRKSPSICACSNRKARRQGLIRQSTQSLSNGCSQTASLYSLNSWYVLARLWKKSLSSTVVMRWHARNALVHLPVMMPATPPKATVSSISTHDAFISVPMHPRNDISVCIIPGCNTSDVQQYSRSIAQYTIYDKALGRLRGVHIALKRYSMSFSFLLPFWRPSWILVTGLQHQLQEWLCSP